MKHLPARILQLFHVLFIMRAAALKLPERIAVVGGSVSDPHKKLQNITIYL